MATQCQFLLELDTPTHTDWFMLTNYSQLDMTLPHRTNSPDITRRNGALQSRQKVSVQKLVVESCVQLLGEVGPFALWTRGLHHGFEVDVGATHLMFSKSILVVQWLSDVRWASLEVIDHPVQKQRYLGATIPGIQPGTLNNVATKRTANHFNKVVLGVDLCVLLICRS